MVCDSPPRLDPSIARKHTHADLQPVHRNVPTLPRSRSGTVAVPGPHALDARPPWQPQRQGTSAAPAYAPGATAHAKTREMEGVPKQAEAMPQQKQLKRRRKATIFFFVIHKPLSISFTRAQGIP